MTLISKEVNQVMTNRKWLDCTERLVTKSVMSIHYLFMDIYDLAHLLDQAIPDMKGFGESSSKGDNWMDQFFCGGFVN